MSGWRTDMENAPKDGTEILGYREDWGIMHMLWTCAAHFMDDGDQEALGDDEWEFEPDWFTVYGDRISNTGDVTHWQPLPEPPQ